MGFPIAMAAGCEIIGTAVAQLPREILVDRYPDRAGAVARQERFRGGTW